MEGHEAKGRGTHLLSGRSQGELDDRLGIELVGQYTSIYWFGDRGLCAVIAWRRGNGPEIMDMELERDITRQCKYKQKEKYAAES